MPPARPPRRGRTRRAPGSAWRPPAPTRAGTGGRPPRPSVVLDDRANLDASALRPGDLGGPLDRLVQVLAVEDVEARELLLGLRERAVGDQALAVGHAHGRRGGDRLEPLAGAEHARRPHLLGDAAVGL